MSTMVFRRLGLRRRPHDGARWTQLRRPRTQLALVLLVGWAPLLLLATIDRLLLGRAVPLLGDVALHVRLLVAVPLAIVAEQTLARQVALTLRRLDDEGFIGDADRPRFAAAAARWQRLRESPRHLAALAALALVFGVVSVLGGAGPLATLHGANGRPITLTRLWYAVVSQPMFGFFLARALWHWLLWSRTLWTLARLRLQLAPGHPDRRGGLRFVTLPSLAFHAPFLLANGSVLAAEAAHLVTHGVTTLPQLESLCFVAVALGELLAFAPLIAFTPRLFLFGRRTLVDYGALATDYARRFDRRWLVGAPDETLLGSPDLQSLNDLGSAFRETVQKASAFVFGLRDLAVPLVALALPALPFIATLVPLDVVLARLGKLLVGMR